ncbi:GH36-type glycosyl hydrolase domain-containing protein [Paenibacillus chungangensis]|uniref:GH36-type glycosyl hydrolase domain-containing protein n=1 Tax=Paenibacillus chungangensis TaxID=696535 RepID=A0ABW3HT03_9BACL
MRTEVIQYTVPIEADGLRFSFFRSGDIQDIRYKDLMLNEVMGNPLDGSMNNLYLRRHDEEGIKAAPLIGHRAGGRVSFAQRRVIWRGEALGVAYEVRFTLMPGHIWFWDVRLSGQGVKVDVVYGQDMGLADRGAVRTNEAYMSQYVDHAVFRDEQRGYVVCSRQNQPMSTGFPYMQQGALTGADGFSTDGFQFFDLSYKETDEPEALKREQLANEVYQYEFAYTALQSKLVELEGMASFVFYGMLKPDHPEAIDELRFREEAEEAWRLAETLKLDADVEEPGEELRMNPAIGRPVVAAPMSMQEIVARFPDRHQEERDGEELLSFFTGRHEHVVLKAKELRVERPHGHIVMSGDNTRMNESVLTSTHYMYGIFNSQITIGNTSFHKLMSNARNALNVLKTSGQRIYVELDGEYRLLTMPSLYEMGFNYSRWLYKLQDKDDTIVVTCWTSAERPKLALEVVSERGIAYRYLVTNQITMADKEYEVPFRMTEDGHNAFMFYAVNEAESGSVCPDLHYRMSVTGTSAQARDEQLLASAAPAGSASLVVLELAETAEWRLTVQGYLEAGESVDEKALQGARSAEADIEAYRSFLRAVMNDFLLSHPDEEKRCELQKVNALAWWYTHNMLVHYSVPHGLEQYSGAAWGTRDVCQGPTEYFMATQKYGQIREILRTVYSHQYESDGNWPQWFMFDRYYRIQQEDSHGDIIVWPLKVLGDYLRVTGDFSILEEKVPYTLKGGEQTNQSYTLLHHAKKEIQYIKDHFLHGTHLSSYGDGDWDDTLQPANAKLKQYMVSSWTVSLTYQVTKELSRVLQVEERHRELAGELEEMAQGIYRDFHQYLIMDGVIPGFVYMESSDAVEPLLHPRDEKTGIQYRLLPMTRSMISELLTSEQADAHYELIKQELYCPDGVRLMNRPAEYKGGVSTRFKRAEQAANFGREVGLQYVHAHIRFIEAMAKLGKADEVWKGLGMINPIGLRDAVPNAEWRQSNAYFSSSDGNFKDRYEAQSGFYKLRSGDVGVKGGWRIYSSGPGIYINQLVSHALGIRQEGGDLVLDPVLPEELDGLQFQFQYLGRNVQFRYAIRGRHIGEVKVNGEAVPLSTLDNRYRKGGVRIRRSQLEAILRDGVNTIELALL